MKVQQILVPKTAPRSKLRPSNTFDSAFYIHPHLAPDQDPCKGRLLRASAAVREGTVLLIDTPYAIVPSVNSDKEDLICSNLSCSRRVPRDGHGVRCHRNCFQDVVWCNTACRAADHVRHGFECLWLKEKGELIRDREGQYNFVTIWHVVRLLATWNMELKSGASMSRHRYPRDDEFSRGWKAVEMCCSYLDSWPESQINMSRQDGQQPQALYANISDTSLTDSPTDIPNTTTIMPAAISPTLPPTGITKFTNCRLLKRGDLVWEDLWVSSATGKIVDSQASFYGELHLPDSTIDLGGRIIAPGLIESQLNGAFGFNFSTLLDDMSEYGKNMEQVNRLLVKTGVTSYIPTITSQRPEMYQKALPYLGPSGERRIAYHGAESLGAHCEGPFLSPTKNGVHNVDVLLQAQSIEDLERCYGRENMAPRQDGSKLPIKMITAAPERGQMMNLIPEITSRGIIYSVGHTEATYEEASQAVSNGARMITHLFNAMRPLHHRNPGVFGVLGKAESLPRPFFGIISDGIHLHPTTIKIAYNAHPDGFILVTDAMHLVGLPDGAYPWTNGEGTCNIIKKGPKLLLENSDTIAGSSITLLECVNNFMQWTGAGIPQALGAVTSTPAAMLGLQGVKGTLDSGADADLVILSENAVSQGEVGGAYHRLVLDEVWKFGERVSRAEKGGNFM